MQCLLTIVTYIDDCIVAYSRSFVDMSRTANNKQCFVLPPQFHCKIALHAPINCSFQSLLKRQAFCNIFIRSKKLNEKFLLIADASMQFLHSNNFFINRIAHFS